MRDDKIMMLWRDIRENYRKGSHAYMVDENIKDARKYLRKAISLSRDLLFELGGEKDAEN